MGGRRGFSLVEVVIAIGVLGFGVAGLLALLPQLMRQAGETTALLVAEQLPDLIRSELSRVGFDAVASAVPEQNSGTDGYRLVVSRDGSRVSALASPSGDVAEDESFYLVEAWRFSDPPLAYNPALSDSLALQVRVSWPYRTPTSRVATASEDRHDLMFALAINR